MLSSNCTHSFCSFQLCRHSDATNAVRNPQRRTHCEATKCCKETIFFSIRVRQTQYATHSGVRTAEPRNSSAFGCDKRNARPTWGPGEPKIFGDQKKNGSTKKILKNQFLNILSFTKKKRFHLHLIYMISYLQNNLQYKYIYI